MREVQSPFALCSNTKKVQIYCCGSSLSAISCMVDSFNGIYSTNWDMISYIVHNQKTKLSKFVIIC
jgi:hypothetical protein